MSPLTVLNLFGHVAVRYADGQYSVRNGKTLVYARFVLINSVMWSRAKTFASECQGAVVVRLLPTSVPTQPLIPERMASYRLRLRGNT
ncbi:MAG: hypothetical protein ACI915_001147 [Gammaproteobacteria bacterium]|jgi:hypothetical protein